MIWKSHLLRRDHRTAATKTRRHFLPLAAVAVSALGLSAQATPTFQTIAVSGQQASGQTTGVTYNSFSLPIINDSGTVAFTSSLGGTTDDESIWTWLNGVFQLAVRKGTKAPGTPAGAGTYVYGSGLLATGFDNSGNVAFSADLANTNGVDPMHGLWRGPAGSVSAVALNGAAAAGFASGYTYQAIASDLPVVQVGGFTAFNGTASNGTTGTDALWKGTPGAITLVASTVSQPPGISNTAARFLDFGAPALNTTGKIAFAADLGVGSGGVTTSNDQGIWSSGTTASLALVARKGTTNAAGTGGLKFAFFSSPQIFSSGDIVFTAQLSGSGVTTSNDTGLWKGNSTALTLLARTGSQAPGTPAGAVYELIDDPVVSGTAMGVTAQLLAGAGGVTEETQNGIWLLSGSALVLAVREGNAAPGLTGLTLDPQRGTLMINTLNHIAFAATLTGPGVVTGFNDEALFAQDSKGVLNFVLRLGDTYQVAPNDIRTIQSFSISTIGSGFTTADSWNDLHQLALGLTFADSTSGIFLVTVPEPASATLLASAGLALLARRRRR